MGGVVPLVMQTVFGQNTLGWGCASSIVGVGRWVIATSREVQKTRLSIGPVLFSRDLVNLAGFGRLGVMALRRSRMLAPGCLMVETCQVLYPIDPELCLGSPLG